MVLGILYGIGMLVIPVTLAVSALTRDTAVILGTSVVVTPVLAIICTLLLRLTDVSRTTAAQRAREGWLQLPGDAQQKAAPLDQRTNVWTILNGEAKAKATLPDAAP